MDTAAIRKPDVMRDAVIASSVYIEHLNGCKRCFHNLCKEAKELENKHVELSNKARNTEEQVLLKVVKEEIIPEGYIDVLTSAYTCLLASNQMLTQESYIGWDSATSKPEDILEGDTGNYCRWELTSALLGRSFLIPADEMVKIFSDLNEYKRQALSLRSVIEAENEYREHIAVCEVKGSDCDHCLSLFKKHEILRLAVMTTDGGKLIYDRYKSLERYITAINDEVKPELIASVDEYLAPFLDSTTQYKIQPYSGESVADDGGSDEFDTSEIQQFIGKYEDLLLQNNKLQEEIEIIRDKIINDSVLSDQEVKNEIEQLRESNRSLRERNNKLNDACKNYSEFTILSRDLLAQYYMLGISDGAIKYNDKLKEISSYLFIHLME